MFNRIQHFYMRSKTKEILITEIPDQDSQSHCKNQQARPMTSKKSRTATARKESSMTTDLNGIIQEENHELDFDSSLGLDPAAGANASAGDPQKSKLKYHLLSMVNSTQGNKQKESVRGKRTNRKKKSSLNHLFERIKTEIEEEIQKKTEQHNQEKSTKRIPKRRMCRLKTKQQFQDQYQQYLTRKEKENISELFRSVNREMKLSLKKCEGNIYFQNIRKDALNKIDYMYYNQKYYDDSEVKHLHSVVESCNALIHKKQSKNQTKPLYNIPKTQQQQLRMGQLHIKEPKNDERRFFLNRNKAKASQRSLLSDKKSAQKSIISEMLNHNEGRYRQVQTQTMRQTPFPKGYDQSHIKSFKNVQSPTSRALKDQFKMDLNCKLDDIVTSCVSEKQKMRQVKNGMKIFQFYCNRMAAGMQSKEKKLENFLKWEDL